MLSDLSIVFYVNASICTSEVGKVQRYLPNQFLQFKVMLIKQSSYIANYSCNDFIITTLTTKNREKEELKKSIFLFNSSKRPIIRADNCKTFFPPQGSCNGSGLIQIAAHTVTTSVLQIN